MDDFPYRKNLSLQMLEEGFHIFKLRFLYFGSYALRLYEPEKLKSFSPPDIDLLVDNDKEKLLSLAKY
ncbi:MAG: hypothetical protein KDK45_25270, partial [Leptospiraceae bacterium]|nr:hypothetical protein [Leptospiraceae bacterium]